MSRSRPGLGVVSSCSARRKIELAPARKHSAWVSSLMSSRPAESRTIDFGIVMRATAMVRTKCWSRSRPALPDNGVPSTCTSMLIGTDSGCCGKPPTPQ